MFIIKKTVFPPISPTNVNFSQKNLPLRTKLNYIISKVKHKFFFFNIHPSIFFQLYNYICNNICVTTIGRKNIYVESFFLDYRFDVTIKINRDTSIMIKKKNIVEGNIWLILKYLHWKRMTSFLALINPDYK